MKKRIKQGQTYYGCVFSYIGTTNNGFKHTVITKIFITKVKGNLIHFYSFTDNKNHSVEYKSFLSSGFFKSIKKLKTFLKLNNYKNIDFAHIIPKFVPKVCLDDFEGDELNTLEIPFEINRHPSLKIKDIVGTPKITQL